MILRPSNSKSICGILNKLNNFQNNEKYIRVIDNDYNNDVYKGTTKTVINCSYVSEWASSNGNAYLEVQLFKHRIRPTHVSLKRRTDCSYATKASLYGLDVVGWQKICSVDIYYESGNDTNVKECVSSRYFSDFRIAQDENSDGYKYMELSNFDIFGYYSSESYCERTSRITRYFNSLISFLHVLIIR